MGQYSIGSNCLNKFMGIEHHGVAADIVVEEDPLSLPNGHDPQWARGLAKLLIVLTGVATGLARSGAGHIKTETH